MLEKAGELLPNTLSRKAACVNSQFFSTFEQHGARPSMSPEQHEPGISPGHLIRKVKADASTSLGMTTRGQALRRG
jgi:hypothetical protein